MISAKKRSGTITASADGSTFTATSFSLHPDGSQPREAFRSERTYFRDIYIPAQGNPTRLFRLHVH